MTIAAWVFARSLNMPDLRDDVRDLLNRHSRENASNTPDFILADFLMSCLEAFEFGVQERESWYGIKTGPKVGDDAKAESPAGNAVPAGYFDGPPNPPLGQPAALDEEIAHEQLMTAAWKQRAEAAEKTLAEVANMCEDHEARYAQIGYLKDRPRRDRQGHGREGGGGTNDLGEWVRRSASYYAETLERADKLERILNDIRMHIQGLAGIAGAPKK